MVSIGAPPLKGKKDALLGKKQGAAVDDGRFVLPKIVFKRQVFYYRHGDIGLE